MSLSFICPACGKSLKAPHNKSEKISACPSCRIFVTVPSSSFGQKILIPSPPANKAILSAPPRELAANEAGLMREIVDAAPKLHD
jgi:hypothetical protein